MHYNGYDIHKTEHNTYHVTGWNANEFDTIDLIKEAIDENNSWRYNEKIALVADSILSSYEDRYTLDVIKTHAKDFKFFLEFTTLETITNDLKTFLDDYAPEFLAEHDTQHALDQIIDVYDNKGKTIDQYCIVLKDHEDAQNYILSLSPNCDSPNGIAMTGLGINGDHLGTKIDFYELPEIVQTQATRIINYVEA